MSASHSFNTSSTARYSIMTAHKVLLVWLCPLPRPLLREIALYLPPCFYFLGISATTLTLYLLPGDYRQTLTHDGCFSDGMRHCWVNSSEALLVGGGTYLQRNRFGLNSVFLFRVEPLIVCYYPSMQEARYSPGVVCVDGTVFVFGGYHHRSLDSGEKAEVARKIWKQLPKMTYGRHSFCPVHYAGNIYLPDISKGNRALEAYSVAQDVYETMSIACESSSAHSCAFLLQERLVVLSCYNFAWSWEIGTGRSEQVKVKTGVTVLSSCAPRVAGNCVYWVEFDSGRLACMDLNSLQSPSTQSKKTASSGG